MAIDARTFGPGARIRGLVRRHGAVLLVAESDQLFPVAVEKARTKRGSHTAFAELAARMRRPGGVGPAAEHAPGSALVVARVESGVVVEEVRGAFPGGPEAPGAGVREPRRPPPTGDRAGAAAEQWGRDLS